MSSIISESNLQKLENFKKYLLKGAIWLLVGAVVVGVFVILLGGSSSGDVVGRFMGTLFIVALMMIISVNNFKMLETRDATIQSFALVGLVFNILWAIFWVIVCWVPDIWSMKDGTNIIIKLASVFSYLSALGFIGSNVMNMYEGGKRSLIRPLKITAVACATYEMLYFVVKIFIGYSKTDDFGDRLNMLAIFVGTVWIFIVIAAWVLSRNEKKKEKKVQQPVATEEKVANETVPSKSEEELRAEIEEQVKKEMIEKEVRARMEAEMGKKEGEQ